MTVLLIILGLAAVMNCIGWFKAIHWRTRHRRAFRSLEFERERHRMTLSDLRTSQRCAEFWIGKAMGKRPADDSILEAKIIGD